MDECYGGHWDSSDHPEEPHESPPSYNPFNPYEQRESSPLFHPFNPYEQRESSPLFHPFNLYEQRESSPLFHPFDLYEQHESSPLFHPFDLYEQHESPQTSNPNETLFDLIRTMIHEREELCESAHPDHPYEQREDSPPPTPRTPETPKTPQTSDSDDSSQSEETEEPSSRSSGTSPSRHRHLWGRERNPREGFDQQASTSSTSHRDSEMLSERLSKMQLVEAWIKAGPWERLANTQVQELPEELETAFRLGVQPMHVDDPGFKQVANAGPIHWAVTENGDLLVVPQTVGTEHIAPTVLTDGGPVVATGVAEIVVDDHGPYGIEISNQSRHFLTDQNSLAIGKQAFQAFGVTFLLEKDCRGDVDGKGSERLSQRQVGETWSQTGAWKLLENTHAQTLPEELATAKRLGVQPMHVDDPGFKQVANAGPIHWAVTQRGDLLVVPQTVGAEHIAPTVLTNGGPVRATGMADIAVDGKRAFGIKISNKSRHFLTDKKSLEIGKQAFQALGITFLLEKDCRGDVDGKGSERLSQRQVGADSWSQAGAWKLLENTHAQTLPKELETAKRLGVQPMHVDDPGFKQVANAGPIHWAVTQRGELLVVPQTVGAEPIAPTVLTNGGPVLATGMADIAVDGKRAFGIEISNKSRHFLTDKKSLEIGKQAFQALGITFLLEKDTSGNVKREGSNSSHERHDKHDGKHRERQNRGDRDGNNGGNGGGHPVAYDGWSSESDEEQENEAALKGSGTDKTSPQQLEDYIRQKLPAEGINNEEVAAFLPLLAVDHGLSLDNIKALIDTGVDPQQIYTWIEGDENYKITNESLTKTTAHIKLILDRGGDRGGGDATQIANWLEGLNPKPLAKLNNLASQSEELTGAELQQLVDPKLEYKPNPKHDVIRPGVSPQPQNGQAALDNSVSYKPTTFSRVGIDPKTEEIAVLDDTNEGTYHGHVETWKDLDNNQRNALQNKGFIDTRGRVIRRDSEGNIIGYGRNVIKGK